MNDLDWLAVAGDRAHYIIIHTVENTFSEIKEKLIDLTNVWHYGPKEYDINPRKLSGLLEYFEQVACTIK